MLLSTEMLLISLIPLLQKTEYFCCWRQQKVAKTVPHALSTFLTIFFATGFSLCPA